MPPSYDDTLKALSEVVTELRIAIATLTQSVKDQHRPPCVHLAAFQNEVRSQLKTAEKIKYAIISGVVGIFLGVILKFLSGS